MKKSLFALVIAVVGITSSASAQPLMNYTYADVAYQWTHIDESGFNDANGLDVNLSFSPVKHFALEGGYNYLSTSANVSLLGQRFKFDVDQNVFTYGGAGWYSIQEDLDIVVHVGGIHARANTTGYDIDETVSDNGVYSGLTLRYLATDALETDLFVTYDRIESGAWTYGLTGLYAVHENVALKGEAGIDNDSDVALLGGVRLAM